MSDLFNAIEYDKSFDANEYVKSLCKNTKIIVPDYVSIQFLPGWKSIVRLLIETIKNYPISLVYINDSYSMLDIEFTVLKQTREVNVWRAINEARNESKTLCAACGSYKNRFNRASVPTVFCEECIKVVAKIGKTETWLDKY